MIRRSNVSTGNRTVVDIISVVNGTAQVSKCQGETRGLW